MNGGNRMAVVELAAVAGLVAILTACTGATATAQAFTATQVCTQTVNGTEAKVGDVTQYRDVVMRCETEASDPRISGIQESVVAIDMRADESADLWGTIVITNDDGTWEGDFTGTVTAGYTTHRIEGIAQGTGAYEGLRLVLHVTSGKAVDYEISGTIEPSS